MNGVPRTSGVPVRGPRPGPGAGSDEAGFVLPAVLAILIVLSAVAATAALRLQTRTTLAGQRGDAVRLQGQADGIARLVAFGAVVERTYRARSLDLPEDGAVVACPLPGGTTARVSLRDQGALLDLNTTPRPQLEDALRALGIPDRDAPTLAAEIVDFRDPDDTPEPGGGAEAPQYRARGLAYGPRNGPFARADEIAQLPSMTPAVAALLLPVVTVFNAGGRFDAARLRRSGQIPAQQGLAQQGLAQQGLAGNGEPSSGASRAPGAGPAPAATPSPRQFLRIEVSVVDARGSRAGRSALVSTSNAPVGIGVVEWVRFAPVTRAGIAHPACPRIAAALGAG